MNESMYNPRSRLHTTRGHHKDKKHTKNVTLTFDLDN